MAKHYEEKVSSLSQKIRDIEMERDTVLANLGEFFFCVRKQIISS